MPPGYTGELNPQVWNRSAKPEQPSEKKIGQLTADQVNEYFDQGVVLVEDYFTPDELEPIKRDLEVLVEYLANLLYEGGKIKDKYEQYGLFQRITMINKDFKGANIILHKLGIMPQSVKDLWSGDKLCNAIEQLIGPDIGGNPVWNIRVKTPKDEATTVPWHQDSAYCDTDSYKVHQPAAWIPLLDTDAVNGCMEFALRGHKLGKIALHQCCEGDTHYVMLQPEEMAKDLDVDLENDLKIFPVKYGSVLFFNNCIPHRSLNNMSGFPGVVRWSLDLRWQDFKLPWGFHGVADGIVFRKSDEPSYRPSEDDWNNFLKVNRVEKYAEKMDNPLQDYDTTIVGPWMKNWDIVNPNRHTAALLAAGDDKTLTWHP